MTSADVRSASSSLASPRGPWQELGAAPMQSPVHTAIARTRPPKRSTSWNASPIADNSA